MQVIPHTPHKPLVTRTPFDQMSNLERLKEALEKDKPESQLFQEECKELKLKVRQSVFRLFTDFRFGVREQMSIQLILSGGSISSIYHGENVKDYDFWCRDSKDIHPLATILRDEAKDIIMDDTGPEYGDIFEATGFHESPNAITLKNRMQLITLSDYEKARQSFDFIHCMPYYDLHSDRLYISMEQWRLIKSKRLVRQHLTIEPSSHRVAKYKERGWKI